MILRVNTLSLSLTFLFGLSLLGMLFGLTACSSNGKKWNPEDYTVKSGDTIYSIAWRYELDPEEFAAWNEISTAKFIKPGQRLHTRKPYNFDSASSAANVAYANQDTSPIKANAKWTKARKGDSLYSISKRSGVSIAQLAQLNQLRKPYTIHPGQTIFLKSLEPSTSKNKTNREKQPVKPVASIPAGTSMPHPVSWPKSIRWQKPAKGKVIKKFSRNKIDAKGIDIAGKIGSAVVAAAGGKVVYSGNGLISYGNLIIIKHNKTYLSAYAYNRKLLVKEGEFVKAGQKIAEMGSKDKTSPRLHFEIRKNGKPVDPLKYLPW